MAWAFTWSLWLTVAAGVLGLFLLGLVLRARVPGRAGAAFVALLALEAVNFLADGAGWLSHFSMPALSAGLTGVTLWSGIVLAPAYLFFLRHAAVTPATRWLTTRWGGWTAIVFAVFSALFAFAVTLGIDGHVPGLLVLVLLVANLAVYVLALVAAVLAFTGASGASERRRGAALLLAFGARDIVWLLSGLGIVDGILIAASQDPAAATTSLPRLYILFGLVGIVYFPAVTYAMLSGRIVDLDQRFRIGLTQTTAAAMVGGFFLVFTESIEASIDTDSAAFSVLVAVVLAFLFRPIQTIAARLTMRLLPSDPAADDDRIAFFEEQVRLAWADGTVTAKERGMLESVARRLHIDAGEAKRIEQRIRQA